MAIPHLLTFPGVVLPTGLIGGLNSPPWVYAFWHAGLPLAAIGYVLLKPSDMTVKDVPGSARTAIFSGIACVILLVLGVTLLATSGETLLPPILLNSGLWADTWWYIAVVLWLLAFTALVVVWAFRKSVLDLLLCVVLCAWVIEVSLNSFLSFTRYTVGWYSGRAYGFVAATFVLIALIAETTTLSARLARSITMQRREREARLWSMEALTASIAHEVAQPLAGVIGNGSAGLRWLSREIPRLDEVRNCLEKVVRDGDRANEVLKSIRAMHKNDAGEKLPVNIIVLIRQSVRLLRRELETSGVIVETNFNAQLSLIVANRVQLQQVLLNLVTNAIDAMSTITDRPRKLRLTTEVYETDSILVSVQDSGPGINPDKVDRIFQPSFTTKTQGMGMGLAICQSIIEAHSGRIWVKSGTPHGALFQFALPVDVEIAGAHSVS
jgi:signal transduction histidine kinase